MGLMLKKADRIYIDANIFIYAIEGHAQYIAKIEQLYNEIFAKSAVLITSQLTLLEVLVKPFKDKNQPLIDAYQQYIASGEYLKLVPISQKILIEAAQLRATAQLKTPDAIHLATALHIKCHYFVTNDKAFDDKAFKSTSTFKIISTEDL